MAIKIYFGNNPLFLCQIGEEAVTTLLVSPDTLYAEAIEEGAVARIITAMQTGGHKKGVIVHDDIKELKTLVWKEFSLHIAAGGRIHNTKDEILFLFRRGKWDMPKGHQDEGEVIETTALREVREETGLSSVTIQEFLLTTYHTYFQNNEWILKESHWYRMIADEHQELIPQTEEDIIAIEWAAKNRLENYLANTFPSIIDVVNA